MIASFADPGTEDVYCGVASRHARARCPIGLWGIARRKLDQLHRSRSLADLRIPPGNRLEALRGDREGQMSIRVNVQYRLCFRWESSDAYEVEITDYHAG